MREREYIIHIQPRPWQRARLNGKYFFDAQTKDKLQFGLYLNKLHGTEPKFEGPLALELQFFMPLPKSTKLRNDHPHHFKRPDLDNLIKYSLDVCTGILWEDDCIIAQINSCKLYDKKPRTVLIVKELL